MTPVEYQSMGNAIHPTNVKILQPNLDLGDFFTSLSDTTECVLFLDYDGTLAPFRNERDKALPYIGVTNILDAIIENGRTRVVIISGRWTKDLVPLLQLKHRPEIWGSHGLERLHSDGSYELDTVDEKALLTLAEADTWEDEIKALGGLYEHKPGCLAIHWRGLNHDQIDKIKEYVIDRWSDISQANLIMRDFDGGLELRAPGRNKGVAVTTVLKEMGPNTVAAYLGDDLTDEDAFKSLKGKGLGALVRREWRTTAADIWLQPPEELLEFLNRWHNARKGG